MDIARRGKGKGYAECGLVQSARSPASGVSCESAVRLCCGCWLRGEESAAQRQGMNRMAEHSEAAGKQTHSTREQLRAEAD